MGYGCGFVVVVVVFHRKIRLTQLWVELSWVVAKIAHKSGNPNVLSIDSLLSWHPMSAPLYTSHLRLASA